MNMWTFWPKRTETISVPAMIKTPPVICTIDSRLAENEIGQHVTEQRHRLKERRDHRRFLGLQGVQIKQRRAHIENA